MMNILLVGCGNLGTAFLNLWVSQDIIQSIVVIQPSLSKKKDFAAHSKVRFVSHIEEISKVRFFDIVVLAIKPQLLGEVMPSLALKFCESMWISLLAGKSMDHLSSYLPYASKIIRLMPNLAVKTGQSMNLAFANAHVPSKYLEIIHRIFSLSGPVMWLSKEALLDKLTPISGSGPAYVYLMGEILTKISVELELEERQARSLVRQTLIGAVSLLTDDFEGLISSVSSKGGVTEVAITELRSGLPDLMHHAVQRALERVQSLGQTR